MGMGLNGSVLGHDSDQNDAGIQYDWLPAGKNVLIFFKIFPDVWLIETCMVAIVNAFINQGR